MKNEERIAELEAQNEVLKQRISQLEAIFEIGTELILEQKRAAGEPHSSPPPV